MSIMWKKFTTAGAVSSIYAGLIVATVLLILSPTVWVEIIHKGDMAAVKTQLKDIDTAATGIDTQIADLQKTMVSPEAVAKMKKKDMFVAEKKNAEIQASVNAKMNDKAALVAKKKDVASQMPQPVFPMRNPGIFSMAAAFLIGILVSLMAPDKEAQEKFDAEKVREYVGIGAE